MRLLEFCVKIQRFSLCEEKPTPRVWVYTESAGFINWFLPRTPNEPRFIHRNCGITGFNELKTGSFGLLSSHQALLWRLHNGLISSKENQATLPDTLSTAQAGEERQRPSQKLDLQQGSPSAPSWLWSLWSFHKHRMNEEEDGYVFNLIYTHEK